MQVVWTPQSPHRSISSIANAWEMQTQRPTSPHQPEPASHPGLRGHVAEKAPSNFTTHDADRTIDAPFDAQEAARTSPLDLSSWPFPAQLS